MNCPVCKDVKLVISDKNGIEIDYCPECRGIWLDRGELDKIIERSTQSFSSGNEKREYNSGYSDDYNKYGYKKKRRGGFLEDLFDF
ncbi:MAG: zf-TFIIB domain-containing protein [Melioribacteraceae bacterium]|nr:zf-TFIIB domain-containing protein [Melioribacteraceae bacterium]